MEIDQVETFLAIAQLGGFTRAGTRVHRSQPAISRRLRMLEDELGAPLLERMGGIVRLTEVGRAFLPHAEAMLAALRDGREAVRAELTGGAGEIGLAMVGTLVDRRLSGCLKRFCAANPKVRLKLTTGSSLHVSQLVRQGEATLGVRYFADPHPELSCTQIGEEPMVVVAAMDHPRLARRTRGVRALASEPWLGFPATTAYKEAFGRVLRRQLSAAGLEHAEVTEVDSMAAQKRLVEAGFGLALLPRSAVQEELATKQLRIVRAPRIATVIPVSLVYRKRAYVSAAARKLHALLASSAVIRGM